MVHTFHQTFGLLKKRQVKNKRNGVSHCETGYEIERRSKSSSLPKDGGSEPDNFFAISNKMPPMVDCDSNYRREK